MEVAQNFPRKLYLIFSFLDLIIIYEKTLEYYIPTDPIGHWKLNGNTNDSSGNGNNATNNGAILTTGHDGTVDGAYYFDGSDYMTIPQTTALDVSSKNSLTISVWINFNNTDWSGDYRNIFKARGSGTDLYALQVKIDDGWFYFQQFTSPSNNSITYQTEIDVKTWYHIVVTLDGTNRKIYINNDFKISDTLQLALPALNTSSAECVPIPENVGVPLKVPDKAAPLIVGVVNILLVNVSLVSLPTSVSVELGRVIVKFAVNASAPIKVSAWLDPLS